MSSLFGRCFGCFGKTDSVGSLYSNGLCSNCWPNTPFAGNLRSSRAKELLKDSKYISLGKKEYKKINESKLRVSQQKPHMRTSSSIISKSDEEKTSMLILTMKIITWILATTLWICVFPIWMFMVLRQVVTTAFYVMISTFNQKSSNINTLNLSSVTTFWPSGFGQITTSIFYDNENKTDLGDFNPARLVFETILAFVFYSPLVFATQLITLIRSIF